MRSERYRTVGIGSEREPGLQLESLSEHSRVESDELRLLVVKHIAHVLVGEYTAVKSPFGFEVIPVDLTFVYGFRFSVFDRFGFLRMFGGRLFRRCLFHLRLLLLRLRQIGLEILENFGVFLRLLNEVRHRMAYAFIAVGRNFEKAESRGVVDLTDKVRQERFYGILTFGEFNEVRDFRRLDICQFRCAVIIDSGYRAYLPGFVIAGNQHFFLLSGVHCILDDKSF